MYLHIKGCNLWVQITQPQLTNASSNDTKWILFMHGFPDTGQMWAQQVTALSAAGYGVLAPDMPGFGRSAFDNPGDVTAYRLRNIVSVMCGLLDELGISSVAVVGHDWGAAVAWSLASQVPHRVKQLLVLSVGHPGAGAAVDPRQRAHWWYQLFFCLPGAEEAVRGDGWALFKTIMGPSCSQQQLQAYITQLERPGALTAALNWYCANTLPRHFAATRPAPPQQLLRMPVLGVWSSADSALLEPQMLASAAYVAPGCWQYVRLEGVGHWIARDAPQQLNELLLSFLAGGRVGQQQEGVAVGGVVGGGQSGQQHRARL